MRVIAGSAKGIRLLAVKGPGTRPILDRVKGSLFNIISDIIPGCNIADLFAGTGGLGIEALSRGAGNCIFVDNNERAVQIIKKNVEKTGFRDRSKVVKANVFTIDSYFNKNNMKFEIILVGAPYLIIKQMPTRQKIFILFKRFVEQQIISSQGIIILQHRKEVLDISKDIYKLDIFDSRIYGNTQLSFIKPLPNR